jgi:Animal haem peroxidase
MLSKRTISISIIAISVATSSIVGAFESTPALAATCSMPTNGYGRMFANLPSATFSTSEIDVLSKAIMAEPEADPTPETEIDAEENLDIPAGYTYFGQFVDHDLTLDDRPNDLTTPTQVSSLINLRTPQFDLDSLYGSGPATSAKLYNADSMHLLEGKLLTGSTDTGARDLPRDSRGQAIVGDPRNDENRIVAGIHSMFIRLHNQQVDGILREQSQISSAEVFTLARKAVVAQYQQLVVLDYLPKTVDRRVLDRVLSNNNGSLTANLSWYSTCMQMPVEFAVAAYRFGHSQVRGLYRINSEVDRLPVFSGSFGTPGIDLVGFSPAPSNFGIDWSRFFSRSGRAETGVQLSYKIDASITNSLSLLPLPVTSAGPADLAKRNLLRSSQLGLPTGQDVARALGVKVLRDDEILIGKATGVATEATAITKLAPSLAGKTPLWAYILAESTASAYRVVDGAIVGQQRAPFRLGPVGSQIVAETFVGLLASDPNSIINTQQSRAQASSLRQLFDQISQNISVSKESESPRRVQPRRDEPRRDEPRRDEPRRENQQPRDQRRRN